MFPTPNAVDAKGGTRKGKGQVQLCHVVRFPTPCGLSSNQGQGDGEFGKAIRGWATPSATDGTQGPDRKRWLRPDGGRDLTTDVGGQLNPTWVEWLMGFPLGWTDLDA